MHSPVGVSFRLYAPNELAFIDLADSVGETSLDFNICFSDTGKTGLNDLNVGNKCYKPQNSTKCVFSEPSRVTHLVKTTGKIDILTIFFQKNSTGNQ